MENLKQNILDYCLIQDIFERLNLELSIDTNNSSINIKIEDLNDNKTLLSFSTLKTEYLFLKDILVFHIISCLQNKDNTNHTRLNNILEELKSFTNENLEEVTSKLKDIVSTQKSIYCEYVLKDIPDFTNSLYLNNYIEVLKFILSNSDNNIINKNNLNNLSSIEQIFKIFKSLGFNSTQLELQQNNTIDVLDLLFKNNPKIIKYSLTY